MFCLLVLCFVLGMSQRSNPMLGLRPIRHGPHGPNAGELPSPAGPEHSGTMQNLKGSHHFFCLVSVGFGWYVMRSSIDSIDVEAKPHSLQKGTTQTYFSNSQVLQSKTTFHECLKLQKVPQAFGSFK
jgi:hypothetical protein